MCQARGVSSIYRRLIMYLDGAWVGVRREEIDDCGSGTAGVAASTGRASCSVSLQRYGDLVRHGERRNLRSKRMTKSISAPARETRAIEEQPAVTWRPPLRSPDITAGTS